MSGSIARSLVAALCAASAVSQALAQALTPEVAFKAHAVALRDPGVRTIDGVTFATVVAPGKLQGPLSSAAALREMLKARMHETLPTSGLPPAVGRAAAFAAVGCVEGTIDASGIVRVSSERLPDGMDRVVHGLPAARVNAVSLDLAGLLGCLDRRLVAGRASTPEVLLLGELVPTADVPGALVRSLSAVCGDGIAATAAGTWLGNGGMPLQRGLASWQQSVAASVRSGSAFSAALLPLPRAELDAIADPEEALRRLGERANDAGLLSRARALLGSLGWKHCVEQLPSSTAPIAAAVDRAGSRLGPELRAQVASAPAVLVLLLTDAGAPLAMSRTAGPNQQRARAAYDAHSPKSLATAVDLLRADFVASPTVEGGVLLSAALLALEDPGLAYPVARACARAAPDHPYAGVNALVALQKLGRAETARQLLAEVESQARLDDWGRSMLASVRAWCAPPAPAQPAARGPEIPATIEGEPP
jgi:hypothetical protein